MKQKSFYDDDNDDDDDGDGDDDDIWCSTSINSHIFWFINIIVVYNIKIVIRT